MNQKITIDYIIYILIIIGSIQSTILGLFNIDIIGTFVKYSNIQSLEFIIYILIGFSILSYIIRNQTLTQYFVYNNS